jgi:hypothetical protein
MASLGGYPYVMAIIGNVATKDVSYLFNDNGFIIACQEFKSL